MNLPSNVTRARPIATTRHALRHAFTSTGALRLHWTELGEDSHRTPIVLLHGLNDSHVRWKRVAPAFAVDRRVLMLDLPGFGLSDRPMATYTLEWHAQVVKRWLDELALEHVDLVGHSFGGGVAQRLLLECPARIRRLVLVASGGLGRQVALSLRLASLPGIIELFGQRFMGFGTRLALRGAHAPLSKAERDELCAMNATRGSARAFARTVRDVIDWRGQRRTFAQRASELGRLPPIAVCWGTRDKIIPITHAIALAELLEGIVLERFDGCGHYPHDERPEQFVCVVRSFLDDARVSPARLRRVGPKNRRTLRARTTG